MDALVSRRYLKYEEGVKRYGICRSSFIKHANEAKAVIKIGKTVLVDTKIFEQYLEKNRIGRLEDDEV